MLETQRLILRQWQERDIEPFAELNADPEVMRYFPSTLTADKSLKTWKKVRGLIEKNGWGWWALERKDTGEFIGATGLMEVEFEAWFTPALEVGWRLARAHWRQGFATEAAQAALEFANKTLTKNEIVSFTAVPNLPSIGVMEKIGMSRQQNNFFHPNVSPESHLYEHVLYKITF